MSFENRKEQIQNTLTFLKSLKTSPKKLLDHSISIKQDGVVRNIYELLSFPNVTFEKIKEVFDEKKEDFAKIDPDIMKQISINALYESYLIRQKKDLEMFKRDENMKIPLEIDYNKIQSLSLEVREKLSKYKPATISQALKIQGITPASIMAVMIYIKK